MFTTKTPRVKLQARHDLHYRNCSHCGLDSSTQRWSGQYRRLFRPATSAMHRLLVSCNAYGEAEHPLYSSRNQIFRKLIGGLGS